MKKIFSVFLAAVMIFSVLGVVFASAADLDEIYTIVFYDEDGSLLATRDVQYYGVVKAPVNPSKADEVNEDGKTVTYTFEGWKSDESDIIYHASTIPVATSDASYTAVYSAHVEEEGQTLMAFIRSIFARINIIFEYFYRLFNRPNGG